MKNNRAGFTVAELMIVLSIMAIIAAMALPKLGEMIRRANEAATKGKLGLIRSSIAIYYADNDGTYPDDLTPMLQPGSKYLTTFVPMYTADHGDSSGIDYQPSLSAAGDNGQWVYINARGDRNWGGIWVECTHTDGQGRVWTLY